MSTGEGRPETASDRGRRLAEEWARERATNAELCRLWRGRLGILASRRDNSRRYPSGIRRIIGVINPELEDTVQTALTRWHEILGTNDPDTERSDLVWGFATGVGSAELRWIIEDRGLRIGETWAREVATPDELQRVRTIGDVLRDLGPDEWEWRLRLLFHPDEAEGSIVVSAVRLINLGHGTDEESAIAYWQRVGGELFDEQGATHSLVLGFLIGAISTVCQIDQSDDLGSGDQRSDTPGPTRSQTENRELRFFGNLNLRRATNADPDADATNDE